MQFSFRSFPHHVTGNPQWQHRCFEGDVKTMYIPHRESPFEVTREGRYEGNVVGPITPTGAVPRILTVMVTGEIKLEVRPAIKLEGRFKQGAHPKSGEPQWRREVRGDDGNVVFIHIIHERGQQPLNDTTDWEYRLIGRISMEGIVPEVWVVELVREVVSERALRRRKQAGRRQALVQARIADLLAEQAERQKFRKELEARNAGGGKNKQQGKKKGKQLAHAS